MFFFVYEKLRSLVNESVIKGYVKYVCIMHVHRLLLNGSLRIIYT